MNVFANSLSVVVYDTFNNCGCPFALYLQVSTNREFTGFVSKH